jgi:cell wall-associated NlpC family hydrolase
MLGSMNRHLAWIAALTGAALIVSQPAHLQAATKKKKPATDTADGAATPAPKHGATPPLDLPLPEPSAHEEKKVTPAPAKPATGDGPAGTKAKGEHAPNATVEPDEIVEFAAQPPRIQQMIRDAVDLTRLNLTYTFGSADPDSGGMDCSGTIYYLLRAHKFLDVPRDSSGQYLWARRGGGFFPVVSKSIDSVEFKELLPGDLMFWTGTYESGRDIPISHVMLYLGHEKSTGKPITFGASDGRSYHGIQRWGVSIFDFKMPKFDPAKPEQAAFVGFARIPGLRGPVPPQLLAEEKPDGEPKIDKPAATPTPKPASGTKSSKKKRKKPSSD